MKEIQLQAKTPNQKLFIRSIYENDITICTGPSGTGKSMISCAIALRMLLKGDVKQIVVTRPLICTGKDIGSLPGLLNERIMPYLLVCEEYFKDFIGGESVQKLVDKKEIRFLPLELMRGSTFHNAFMILDEAQNCTLDQIKMFISRMGQNTKLILNGDERQTDLRDSGIEYVKGRLQNISRVGVCELHYSDIQRNDLIGKVLMALE